jgi:phosphoribosylaminoimidazolecarboxamide formyltransferase/IMP cyclohydrolase
MLVAWRQEKQLVKRCCVACDPISFGGVLIANTKIDVQLHEINKLFCEVVIAPEYERRYLFYKKEKQNYFNSK